MKKIIFSAILGYSFLSNYVNGQSQFNRPIDERNINSIVGGNNLVQGDVNRATSNMNFFELNKPSIYNKNNFVSGNSLYNPIISKEQNDLLKLLDVMKNLIKNNPKLV